MPIPPAKRIYTRVSSAARGRLLWIASIVAVFLIITIAIFDRATAGKLRGDILFLVQVGSLVFLVIYVIATNRIAQSNESAAKATQESADAAKRAAETAIRATATSEAMFNEARATRLAQEKQAAPRVVVYAELIGLMRYLTVENVGQGFATEVRLSFTPPFQPQDFVAGMMPDFFGGGVFTLKPGEKKQQPLAQNYRLPFNLTTPIEQTATATYSGGMLSGEATETFPINLSGYDNTLVTQTPVELALDKLDKLIKAVDQTGEAVKSVGKQLDAGLLVSASVLNQPAELSDEAYVEHFRRLVDGLADEWRIWRDKGESQFYMMRPMKRRVRILTEAALVTLAHLPIPIDEARHIRSLFFDIQAAHGYPYGNRDFDEDGIITRSLDELLEIAQNLNVEVGSHDGRVGNKPE